MKNKASINPRNILAWIQGNLRYKLWYFEEKTKPRLINTPSGYDIERRTTYPLRRFIRKHIQEQIEFRIRFMKFDCYMDGSCVKCGCVTTALQMANKACDGLCYPSMMNKKEWENFKKGLRFEDKNGTWYFYAITDNMLFIPKNPSEVRVVTLIPTNKLCGLQS